MKSFHGSYFKGTYITELDWGRDDVHIALKPGSEVYVSNLQRNRIDADIKTSGAGEKLFTYSNRKLATPNLSRSSSNSARGSGTNLEGTRCVLYPASASYLTGGSAGRSVGRSAVWTAGICETATVTNSGGEISGFIGRGRNAGRIYSWEEEERWKAADIPRDRSLSSCSLQ